MENMIRHMAIKTLLGSWMIQNQLVMAGSKTPPSMGDVALMTLMEMGLRAESLQEVEVAVDAILSLVDMAGADFGDAVREKLNETEGFFTVLMKGSQDEPNRDR